MYCAPHKVPVWKVQLWQKIYVYMGNCSLIEAQSIHWIMSLHKPILIQFDLYVCICVSMHGTWLAMCVNNARKKWNWIKFHAHQFVFSSCFFLFFCMFSCRQYHMGTFVTFRFQNQRCYNSTEEFFSEQNDIISELQSHLYKIWIFYHWEYIGTKQKTSNTEICSAEILFMIE